MKYLYSFFIILAVFFSLFCQTSSKEMTPEDFIKIEDEFLASERTDGIKSSIAKKHGYTGKQFDDYTIKVESDEKLQEKLGEIRLNLYKNK